jgi:hypothetical protein
MAQPLAVDIASREDEQCISVRERFGHDKRRGADG